ncbi:MAG: sensor histidine kinase [Phycisphaerae bacterium]
MYALTTTDLSHGLGVLHPQDLYVVAPTLLLALVGVVAIGLWARHLVNIQAARTRLLADDLRRMQDESRRRLNFLNAISHDLRTPLNGMTLQTHVIERAVESRDELMVQEAIHHIRSSSALAAGILDSLLQYARTEVHQNHISRVSLAELIQQTADSFRGAAEEKLLTFTVSVPAGLWIDTDRDKLQRVIANLLDNAVKFTARGSIALHVSVVHGDGRSREGSLVIEVADTGEGMRPEDRGKLFNEFFQVNNPSRDARLGLGLGLVVANRLTEQLGGELTCESVLHEGSTFRAILPMHCPLNSDGASCRKPNCAKGSCSG